MRFRKGGNSAPFLIPDPDAVTIRSLFPILAVSTFFGLLGMGIIIPIIPIYMRQMDVGGIWIGIFMAAFSGTRVVLAPFIGRLSDKRGRRGFFLAGLTLSLVSYLGYIWVYEAWQLTLVRVIHGAAGGMIFPIAMSYVGDFAPEGEEGSWMGYFTAIVFTAFAVGPFLGGILTENFGIPVAFIAVSSLGFGAVLVAFFRLPESRFRTLAGKKPISTKILLSSGMIQGLFVFRLSAEAAFSVFISFLPIMAALRMSMQPTFSGLILTISSLLASAALVPFGRLTDRVNRAGMVVLSGLALSICMFVIPLMGDFWGLLVVAAVIGVVGAAPFPPSSALAVEAGRQYGMGSVVAVLTMANSLGMVVGPLFGGMVMEAVNVEAVYYTAGGVLLLGVLLFILLALIRNRRPAAGAAFERGSSG